MCQLEAEVEVDVEVAVGIKPLVALVCSWYNDLS
jgi:hypothetical protein